MALKQWVACKLGRHFWVEFETEPDDTGLCNTFVYCLHCGTDE